MTDYLISPVAERTIPVTRGADRAFTIRRVDDQGDPVNFGMGTTVYMWVDIDVSDPTKVEAAVSGSEAAFLLPSTVLDQVRNRTRWQIVWDQGDVEIPVLVGRFERNDG
jgi:hypothetical protein